ncbi:DUF6193 family natural product biosynthesis protein [Kitasatospora cheerisanensis]|uniref:Uncharacterized protein n=1 Tax=Kitasatospora cheerisanensis KCTC 2395 TaxID=1348663 RepID=A0A066YGE9_9ACTN|nr:DUF6193 family natural product biosynthesis protein [Kitasatospora cheerisanensis]KDN80573.1 hypothetical protein KCH_76220 [Kitasatospora cheerisanensis KCTC 2395]
MTFGETLLRTAEGLGVVLPEQETWSSAAKRLGVTCPEPEKWSSKAEYVDAGLGRRVTVTPADAERGTYWVHLRSGHLFLADGLTADPAEMVRAVAAWLGGAGLEEVREQAPCIGYRPWALAHEREPLGAVELEWCRRLDRVHRWPMNGFPRVHALLTAAYAQPVLRQLMPVTSHFNLWFSTSIKPNRRINGVGPMIWPHYERSYAVLDGHEVLARFETPEEAVTFVVAGLPEGIGPAT